MPIFPFVYVATGKVAPWVAGLGPRARRVALGGVLAALAANGAAVAAIHPHYLSYFNQVAGGPDRGSEHLIDSSLDWGQDLVTLGRWLRANHPGRPVGLAYFGQVNPSLLKMTGNPAGFDWFIPPALGNCRPTIADPSRLVGPARTLRPGLYAVSASIVRGLPWRLYDSVSLIPPHQVGWQAAWSAEENAFAYFAAFEPIARVGHSIFVYDVTEADVERWTKGQTRSRLPE